jgi:eukaryotic-like serine/threonine-protein kinase
VYTRSGEVVAQAFDPSRLTLEGDPTVVASRAWAWNSGGMAAISAAKSGLLLYATRRTTTTQLTWFDRSGRPGGTLGEPGEWAHLELSPDERTIAAERVDPRAGVGAIWTIDVARNVPVRLTPDPIWYLSPIWSPDGRRLAFGASREGASNLFAKPADGSGPEELLYQSDELKVPTDWTRDGRVLFNANGDVKAMSAGADHHITLLLNGSWNESSGKVSPDGRWLAYASNESGRPEVYVRGMDGNGRWQISRSGGLQPRWRRDGAELFFLSMDATLTAARITATRDAFGAGEPEPLPIKVLPDVTEWRYGYDVAAQGQRFLIANPVGKDLTPSVIVVVNWTGLLKQKTAGAR